MKGSPLSSAPRAWTGSANTLLRFLVVASCFVCTLSRAPAADQAAGRPKEKSEPLRQKGSYPTPPYPEAARQAHIGGNGKVRVSFDAQGKVVSAVMIESTGSTMLDANVSDFITKHWRSPGGKPYVHDANVVYGHFHHGEYYYTPEPPYGSPNPRPLGTGLTARVRVTYEKNGNASKVTVIKSSGNSRLDKMATDFILGHWVSYLHIHEARSYEIQFSPDAPAR